MGAPLCPRGLVTRSPGGVRNDMTYYRDAKRFCPRPLGNTCNASNALTITW